MGELASALRALRRTPALAATIVALLALGIGVTTAIFTVVDALLLRPLPYANANRLDFVRMSLGGTLRRPSLSGAELVFLRDHSRVYDQFAAAYSVSDPLT